MFSPPRGDTKMPKMVVEQTGSPIESGSKSTDAGAYGKDGKSKLIELEMPPLPGDDDRGPRVVQPDASWAWSPLQIQLYRSQLLSCLVLVGGFEAQTDEQGHFSIENISAADCSNWLRHVQADEGVPAPGWIWVHPWQSWRYVTAPLKDALATQDIDRDDPRYANLLIGDAFKGDPARPRTALSRTVTIGSGTAKGLTFCGEDKAIDTQKAMLCLAAHLIISRYNSDADIKAAGALVAVPRAVLSEDLLGEIDLTDLASTFNFPLDGVPVGVLKLMAEAYCHASLHNTLATALATDVASKLQKSEWKSIIVPGVTVVPKTSAVELKSTKRKHLALQAVVFMNAADADLGQKVSFGGGGSGTMMQYNQIVDDVCSGDCGISSNVDLYRAMAMPEQDMSRPKKELMKEKRDHCAVNRKRRKKFRDALYDDLYKSVASPSPLTQFFKAFPPSAD